MAFRPRVRRDASGYLAREAGQWAADKTWPNRADLERIVTAMPNGNQIEIVEVAECAQPN